MQAIILAAGMGKRLGALTRNNTKCMIQVNGVTLIERMMRQLDRLSPSLEKIVIVTGYEGEKLKTFLSRLDISTPVEYVDNPLYASTNNIYSLYLAKEHLLQDDTLLFESDLIFEDSVIDALLRHPYPSLALVAKFESWMDGTVVTLDEDDNIRQFIPGSKFSYKKKTEYFKTVNIYKFSREFSRTHYVPFLTAYSKALGNNEYYEQVLRVIALLDKPEIKALRLGGEAWYEIDDIQDLDIAASIFTPDREEHLRLMESRYGGYWRYPRIRDFCYLVNPYFPNKRLMSELKANFERLVREYPSGMRVNSLLAAKYFGISQEYICIGNGAAELIKALMSRLCNAPRHLIELRQVSYITCLSASSVQGVCIDSASPLQAASRSPQSTASSSSLSTPSRSILSLASASRCITLARSLAGWLDMRGLPVITTANLAA